MGVLIPFPGDRSDNMPQGDEAWILSETHKAILRDRIKTRKRSVTTDDLSAIRQKTANKLENIHHPRSFVKTMIQRIRLLYDILFDTDFQKSSYTTKTIAAGLLYFVSPKDFLPDDIPGLGYLDDAYVIAEVWNKAFPEIQAYLAHKGLDKL